MLMILLVSFFLQAPVKAEPKYAKPEMLVTPADAAKATTLIFDVRAKPAYAGGHIPGAVQLGIGPWGKAINAQKADAAFWKKELAAVGVGPKATVLVYSDNVIDMCRAWWMFELAGVPNVRILNGGWDGYIAAKLEVSTTATMANPAEPYDWVPEKRFITKADVIELANAKDPGLLDARTPTEYAAGRIPGATHLEWTDLLDGKTKQFLPAATLAELFATKKVNLGQPCVTYCQSGGRASVLAFGLELMGAKAVRNYHPSWGEYGADREAPKEK